jgi:predicted house-cleaning noncanonical NTP pyrophosphatase (MazG superfamily)
MPISCRKLVRDRIPEIIQADGRRPVTRVLHGTAYRAALLAKLVEEADEASHAAAADLPGELADILEVLRALTAATGMSWVQLLALADDKLSRRGGFTQRIFLESVE